MSRLCREGCGRPAAPKRRQCSTCKKRQYRIRKGVISPWVDADETDVELIVECPRPVEGLTRLERVLIARGLNNRDMTAEQIAAVIGVSPRTVYRWRNTEPASTRTAA